MTESDPTDIERLSKLDQRRLSLREAMSTIRTIRTDDPGTIDAASAIIQAEIGRIEAEIKEVEGHMCPDTP